MRIILMSKSGGTARIEFYGCPLRCEYCTHSIKGNRDVDIMEILEFIADPEINQVYLGGAEPFTQSKDLYELLSRIHIMPHKRTILKTSGYFLDRLEKTLGLVHRYMVEIKCPFDDLGCNSALTGLGPEGAKRYAENLRRSLSVLDGRRIHVWIRVIPGFMDEERMRRIGEEITGSAEQALLLQFLSNPENERPFRGIDKEGPEESEMVKLGRVLAMYVPRVIIKGKGFHTEIKAG